MPTLSSTSRCEDQKMGRDGRSGSLETAAHWEGGGAPNSLSPLVSLFRGRDT